MTYEEFVEMYNEQLKGIESNVDFDLVNEWIVDFNATVLDELRDTKEEYTSEVHDEIDNGYWDDAHNTIDCISALESDIEELEYEDDIEVFFEYRGEASKTESIIDEAKYTLENTMDDFIENIVNCGDKVVELLKKEKYNQAYALLGAIIDSGNFVEDFKEMSIEDKICLFNNMADGAF